MAFLIKVVGINEWGAAAIALVVAVMFQLIMGLIISRTRAGVIYSIFGFLKYIPWFYISHHKW